MKRAPRAAPLLLSLLLLAACTPGDAVPAGGAVTDRANEARERRVTDYLWYQEQDPPRSPAWVDQRGCVSQAAFGTAFALGRHLFPTDDGPSIASGAVQEARDIGDPELLAVAEMTESVGQDLGSGQYGSIREAIAVPLALCTVTELDEEVIETTIQTAIDTQIDMMENLGLEPWIGPDGTRPGSITNPAEPAIPPNPEADDPSVDCEQEVADALSAWASGEFDQESLLEPFTQEGRAVVIELMNVVVESGLGPNDAPTVMGNASYAGLCLA